jgi:hypothetical protein
LSCFKMPRTRVTWAMRPTMMRMASWFSSSIFLRRSRFSCNRYCRNVCFNNSSKSSYCNSSRWLNSKILVSRRCQVWVTEFSRTRTYATSWPSLWARLKSVTNT